MPYKDPVVKAQKQKEYSKKYYENNKEKQIALNRKNRKESRRLFNEFKSRLSCVHCGQNHPATLDFHHHTPHPANRKISALISDGQYTKAIEEIEAKCIVLCSNCHRIVHYNEQKAKAPVGALRPKSETVGE